MSKLTCLNTMNTCVETQKDAPRPNLGLYMFSHKTTEYDFQNIVIVCTLFSGKLVAFKQ